MQPMRPLKGLDEYQDMTYDEGMLGRRGAEQWSEIQRGERQRIWDTIRESARQRYERGEMPYWFDESWLELSEAPVNRLLREEGFANYQNDDSNEGRRSGGEEPSTSGGSGDSGSGGWGGAFGGWRWRWWREEDPYWPLRDWGSHPMRWWTVGFAAVVAVGGLLSHCLRGGAAPEHIFIAGAAAAALAVGGMAMSDMGRDTNHWAGELGVKLAWSTCALLAWKDFFVGWASEGGSSREVEHYSGWGSGSASEVARRQQRSHAFGWACVGMCLGYMSAGMSGMTDWALPTNPGAVYKSQDVAHKHRVWDRFGYGENPMR